MSLANTQGTQLALSLLCDVSARNNGQVWEFTIHCYATNVTEQRSTASQSQCCQLGFFEAEIVILFAFLTPLASFIFEKPNEFGFF